MKNNILYIFLALSIAFTSCEDALQVTPRDAVDASQLITNANSAAVAVNGMYDQLQDDDIFGLHYIMVPDLLADNTKHSGTFTSYREIDDNDILSDNVDITTTWGEMYEAIYRANLIIDLLPGVSDTELDPLKDQYDGEAKFVRAVMYFQLVRLFGRVPLITEPTRDLNSIEVPRSAEADVLAQIISDLEDARDQIGSSGDRTKASAGAANAYLAKVHLWMGNNAEAGAAADAVMADAVGYTMEADYANLWSGAISDEALFQVDFNAVDGNSMSFWFWDDPNGRHEFAPTDDLMAAYEMGDARMAASFTDVVNSADATHYVTKYSDFATGTDKPYGMRLADVKLIKAEAAARQGDYATAETQVNEVRARAGLAAITVDASNFEDVILQERRVELAFEGDRWFDLRRTGRVSAFLTGKGRQDCQQLLPIPQADIDTNPAIADDQNPCY
jgi:hypothetical protein